MCLITHIVPFLLLQILKYGGIRGNDNLFCFFCFFFKVILDQFFWNLKFFLDGSISHYSPFVRKIIFFHFHFYKLWTLGSFLSVAVITESSFPHVHINRIQTGHTHLENCIMKHVLGLYITKIWTPSLMFFQGFTICFKIGFLSIKSPFLY